MPPLARGRRVAMLALLVGLGLGQAAAAAGGALCVRALFDALSTGNGLRLTSPWTLGLIASALTVGALEAWQRASAEMLALDYTSEVRLALFDHLADIPADRLARRSQGGLLLPFVGDLSALRLWASQGLARLLVGGVMAAGVLVALVLSSPMVAMASGAVLLAGAFGAVFLGPPMERAVRQVRRRRASLTSLIASRISALATLQALGGARRERTGIDRRNRALNLAAVRRAALVGALRGLSQLTTALLAVAALVSGGAALASGELSLGGVVAAMGLVGLMGPAILDLGRAFELWRPAKVASEKIRAIMAEPVRQTAASGEVRRGGAPLVFQALRPRSDSLPIDVKLRRGAVALITGRAGVGKSALANLAAGLAEPEGGRVLIKGRDAAGLTPAQQRRLVGFASPAAPLIRGSLRMNLSYRVRAASDDVLAEVIALCGLDRLVRRLPQGLDSPLTESGLNLSDGERQAVILARALLGAPALLILDSIDSALDPAVINRLALRLSNWPGGVLMIARSPALIATATETWAVGRDGLRVRRSARTTYSEAAE